MNKGGPIVLIDDDQDDLQLLIEIFADLNLPNEIHLFKNTSTLLAFLQKPEVNPFMIISDINMPVTNGFELKQKILDDPLINAKRIPYIFFTTASVLKVASNPKTVSFHGIFKKPSKHEEWKEILMAIVKYWTLSMPPDEYTL